MIDASTRRTTGTASGKRLHGLLVAGQVALTLLLLTAAGAAIKGFLSLMHINLGYDPHNTMSVGIPVHENTYMSWADRSQLFDQIRTRIAAMPEVVGTGISTNATPPDNGWNTHFEILGQSVPEEQQARTNFISPEYFTVLRIPLLAGRMWDHAETMRGARVALINQNMARQYWPLGDAIGRQIRIPQMKADPPYSPAAPDSDNWLQVIGIVGDARDDGLRQPIKPGIYVPYTMKMPMYTQILVRTRGAPLALLRAVRTQVHAINADQQVQGRVRSLEEWHSSKGHLFFGDLPLPVAQMPERIAEAAVRLRRARLQPDRFVVLACGVVPTLLPRMDRAEFGVRRGHTGFELQGLLLFALVPIEVADLAERSAQLIVVAGHFRVKTGSRL
jgi:putative ABC transport system permease protein